MEDRHILQANVKKLELWAEVNGLTLNPSKTYQVSYGKKLVHSIYFLKGRIIEKTATVRDLGVIFDEDLTFKHHIDYINKRSLRMIGAARKFVIGIKHHIIMAKIYRIYIQPVLEYCSTVWNQNRITSNTAITLAHKKVTRIALNVYHTMNPSQYINYEKRCEILNQDNPTVRRTTQAGTICVKILRGEMPISFGDSITEHLYDNPNSRIYHLFKPINRSIP